MPLYGKRGFDFVLEIWLNF